MKQAAVKLTAVRAVRSAARPKKLSRQALRRQLPLHILIAPSILIVLIFNYIPMLGLCIAFQRYDPSVGILGSAWVGVENFRYIFTLPDFLSALRNTVFISFMKIVTNMVCPIALALMLNEVKSIAFKRSVQTVVYLPHFLSWVILGGILTDLLSPSEGIVNHVITALGGDPVFFLGDAKVFPFVLVVTNIWKETGWQTIVYMAAITAIDPTLYEAAFMDGASRLRQVWNVTLPSIKGTIVLLLVMSLGSVLNAGFDQVFNLYSPQVYSTGDVLDTMVYRMGLVDAQFGPSTAMGLFKSLVSLVFVSASYKLADKIAGYRVF